MQILSRFSQPIFILAGKRTPFGSFNGSLSALTATDLAVHAAEGLFELGINPADIQHVVVGNVIQSSSDAAYLARHVGLRTNVPQVVSALTVNRLCGSGFEAVTHASDQILLGKISLALAGGTENMSMTPFQVWGARKGIGLGQQKMTDALWDGLTDSLVQMPMGITAENIAKDFSLTRKECDEYALTSQKRAAAAKAEGFFQEEIRPLKLSVKGKEIIVSEDEHARPQTTGEDLAKLKPSFLKDGVVTPGSASGIVDGAAMMIVGNETAAKQSPCGVLGAMTAYAVCGCDPSRMGMGPVSAIRGLMQSHKLELTDIDLFEINEAFAPQVIAVAKELKIPLEKLNVNGGSIALGHPLGATGSRLIITLLRSLKKLDKKRGIASACIGGGQGIAVMVETV